ncbi:FAD binding domain-containing protein [Selenihalanaerobacter shriftii]|uniref:Carbon-monoxide dehydrogenase medium subunit n=1 Tax=Selenihalanaerobacter shriftii TaxID=142842 RepID=A0A1T4JK26_9FIRM|nr:xanthine dehydrogenase family protein subunit M [Selenihalanaerobacter shriftii]SJZ30530.1 carbon-monoxide dehydrogenase medium subunit [Selenihalanaerobacter shriftii]
MKKFDLYQPTTIEETLGFIEEQDDYRLLAGGTDLLVRWKRSNSTPENVINLKKVRELNFLEFNEKGMEIGALVKIADLIKNDIVKEKYPALVESCAKHSSPLIRNLATVVGNICNASPAADLTPALLVYDARIKIKSKDGERLVELKDFFAGPGKTKLKPGEIVVSIIVPEPDQDLKSHFLKEGKRKAHEIAIINCAVSYLNKDGEISDLKIAMGAVGPTPVFLNGLDWFTEINENNLERLSQVLEDIVSPITDQRSTDWYRKDVIQVLVKRAIISANSI